MKLSSELKIVISVFIFGILLSLFFYFFIERGFMFHFFPDGYTRIILQQSCSPCSTYKLVLKHRYGGHFLRGGDFYNVYILDHDINMKKIKWATEKYILQTEAGNVENVSWIDNMNVLIRVKSRELISYRARNHNGINIFVETGEIY